MTGKAAVTLTPRALIIAIHGAYSPTPIVMSAPSRVLIKIPSINFIPCNPYVSRLVMEGVISSAVSVVSPDSFKSGITL